MAKVFERILAALPKDKVEAFKELLNGVDIEKVTAFTAEDFAEYIGNEANKDVVRKEFDRYTSKGIESGIKGMEEKLKKKFLEEEFPRLYEERLRQEYPDLKPDDTTKAIKALRDQIEQEKRERERLEKEKARLALLSKVKDSLKHKDLIDAQLLLSDDENETLERVKKVNEIFDSRLQAEYQRGMTDIANKYHINLTAGDDQNKASLLKTEYQKALKEGRTEDALRLQREIATKQEAKT